MDLEQLRYFSCVASCDSFAKAADEMFITKGGLTYQVKQMERELGFELFERDSHHVELTARGAALLPAVREMLATWDAVLQRVQKQVAGPGAVLHVGMAQFMDQELLAKADAQFRRRMPNDAICPHHAAPLDPSVFLDGLAHGDLDVAFMTQREVGAARSIAFQPLCPSFYGCLMEKGHPLAEKDALAWSDLDGQTVVLLAGTRRTENRSLMRDTHAMFEQRCPGIVLTYADSPESLRYMVEHDGVVGVLPFTSRETVDAGRLILRVVARETETFGLAWLQERPNPARDVYVQACTSLFGQSATGCEDGFAG